MFLINSFTITIMTATIDTVGNCSSVIRAVILKCMGIFVTKS